MADGIVGQTITERFRTSAAGETFTISSATNPDGTAWAGPTITTVSGALYQVSFSASASGVYLATITGNTSGEVFSGAWDILAASTRSFPTRANGQVILDSWFNDIHNAIEEMSH